MFSWLKDLLHLNNTSSKSSLKINPNLKHEASSIITQTMYRYDVLDRVGNKNIGNGFWFTPDQDLAKSYCRLPGRGKYYKVKLINNHALIIDCKGNRYNHLIYKNCDFSNRINTQFSKTDSIAYRAKEAGYDTVIFLNVKENNRDIVTCSIWVSGLEQFQVISCENM